jgi:alpha-methylacyl-CoA racemase
MTAALVASGLQGPERRTGLLDGGTPFYDLYETADGRHMSVGALEPQFYDELVRRLELTDLPDRNDPGSFRVLREAFTTRFKERTQAEWAEMFEGTDACVAAVIPLREAVEHPHLAARATFVRRDGVVQPAPAPRFSRTEPSLTTSPPVAGQNTREALEAWGIDDVDGLVAEGAAIQAD